MLVHRGRPEMRGWQRDRRGTVRRHSGGWRRTRTFHWPVAGRRTHPMRSTPQVRVASVTRVWLLPAMIECHVGRPCISDTGATGPRRRPMLVLSPGTVAR